jgi:hypothetical protein
VTGGIIHAQSRQIKTMSVQRLVTAGQSSELRVDRDRVRVRGRHRHRRVPERAHPDRGQLALNVAQHRRARLPVRKRRAQLCQLGRKDPADPCVGDDGVQQPRYLKPGISPGRVTRLFERTDAPRSRFGSREPRTARPRAWSCSPGTDQMFQTCIARRDWIMN